MVRGCSERGPGRGARCHRVGRRAGRCSRWGLEGVSCRMRCAARMPRADARWQAVRRGDAAPGRGKRCNRFVVQECGGARCRRIVLCLCESFAYSAAAGHARCHQQLLPPQINAQLKCAVPCLSLCCEPVRIQTGLKWRESSGESCGSLRLEQEGVEPLRDQGAHSLGVALLCLSLACSGARAAGA